MMQQLAPNQASAEVPINDNFKTLSHQAVYGNNPATSSGLTWGYYGGRWSGFSVAAGTLSLAASQTNHVVVARATGVISTSTSATNWNNDVDYARVYKIVTGGSAVTSFEDHRAGAGGVHGGGGGGATDLGDLSDVDVAGVTEGQALVYNGSTGWEARNVTSDASDITYTPSSNGEWGGSDPGNVDSALDQLAARVAHAESYLPQVDPHWADVLLLLPLNEPSGSTSATDLSASPKTVTFNGSSTINNTGSKFYSTSYQGNGSSYLHVALGAEGNFTGEFCIEFWYDGQDNNVLMTSESSTGLYMYSDTWRFNGGNIGAPAKSTGSGVWSHFCCERDASNVVRVYLNGVVQGSATLSAAQNFQNLSFGRFAPNNNLKPLGRYQEIRITKKARYGGDFTVATGPFAIGHAGLSADAADVTYTPSSGADWDGGVDPGSAADALDQLADRLSSAGTKTIPQNSQSGDYTLTIDDSGKHLLHPSGAGSGNTFTIPSNASVPFDIGTVVVFVNLDSNAISIAIDSDTLRFVSDGTTGSRSLAQYGIATVIKVDSTNWLIRGVGLT